jgi:lipopolysaccharide/colanic/teichoic acid biosynthesis glycosyltransferase
LNNLTSERSELWCSPNNSAKRAIDVLLSAAALLVGTPLLLLAAALIKLESNGAAFYRQKRVGRDGRLFDIYKLRSMREVPGQSLTIGDDQRITRVGRIIRRFKIDELPQFYNVLRGDMSIVGPRPEIPEYVALFPDEYHIIHYALPGVTDYASILYRHEAEVLASYDDPNKAYVEIVLPEKLKLAKEYIHKASLTEDLRIIRDTAISICQRSGIERKVIRQG